MHADGWGSATYPWSGPLGDHPRADSERMAVLGGECANVTFDRAGRIVTVCGTFTGFLVKLLDPRTLATLAEYRVHRHGRLGSDRARPPRLCDLEPSVSRRYL